MLPDLPSCAFSLVSCESLPIRHHTGLQGAIEKLNPRGAWVAQSVERLTSAQVMASRFVSSSPASGSVLMNSSGPEVCFGFCVSLSLSAPPQLVVRLFLSQK